MLAWRISVSFLIIFCILGVLYAFANPIGLIPVAAVISVSAFGLYYLNKTKNVRLVFWIFAVGGSTISIFAMNAIYDYTHYVDFLWLVCCILVAFIGLGSKEGIFFIFTNAVGIGIFFFLSLNKHIEVLEPRTLIDNIADFVEVLFAFGVISYLLKQFVFLQRHAENELMTANKNLETKNRLIEAKSYENETLIKEVHHRVKNNLQIIISLLRMQSQDMKTSEGLEHFKEAISRIMAMSLIHEKLYAEKELSSINLQSYIEELAQEIISANTIGKNEVKLNISTDIEDINLNTIVPLGLLINELLSNSLKHGLKDIDNGIIDIKITKKGPQYQFAYSDNGTWKEAPAGKVSFGIELIDILTEQLNGKKSLNTENGTSYLFLLNDA